MTAFGEYIGKIFPETISHIVALLIVAALSAGFGYTFGEQRGEMRVASAALNYANILQKTIEKADSTLEKSGTSPEYIRVYARSIVLERDNLRAAVGVAVSST